MKDNLNYEYTKLFRMSQLESKTNLFGHAYEFAMKKKLLSLTLALALCMGLTFQIIRMRGKRNSYCSASRILRTIFTFTCRIFTGNSLSSFLKRRQNPG